MSNMPPRDKLMREDPALLHLVAACMAVSNMGHDPDYSRMKFTMGSYNKHIERGPSRYPLTLSSAVCLMAEQYMETDEHQQIFEEEAKAWYDRFHALTWFEAAWDYRTVVRIYNEMRSMIDAS